MGRCQRAREGQGEDPSPGPTGGLWSFILVEYTLLCSEKITSVLTPGPQRESSEKSAVGFLVVPSLQPGDWRSASSKKGTLEGLPSGGVKTPQGE